MSSEGATEQPASVSDETEAVKTIASTPSADDVVESFFEGLDEDSFIADLQVVSAWEDQKPPISNLTVKPETVCSPNPTPISTDIIIEVSESSPATPALDDNDPAGVESPGVESDSKSMDTLPKRMLPKKFPTFKNVKAKQRTHNEESALDKFKSFLSSPNQTQGVPKFQTQNPKVVKRTQMITTKPVVEMEKTSEPVGKSKDNPPSIGTRRDPDKTKRDIEKDKLNKNKETLIKKMETGLIPPGMEMDNDNATSEKQPSNVVAVVRTKKKSKSPIKFKSRSRNEYVRHTVFPSVGERRRRTPSLSRSPSFNSANRGYHPQKYERSHSKYVEKDSRERDPRQHRDYRDVSKQRKRNGSYERRRRSNYRSDSRDRSPRYRKSRLSVERELRSMYLKAKVRTSPVKSQFLAAQLDNTTSFPPLPVPAPAVSYPTFAASNYSLDLANFDLNTPVSAPAPVEYPSDYYMQGGPQQPVYNPITYNPEFMPPTEYNNGYPPESVYQGMPPSAVYTNTNMNYDGSMVTTNSLLPMGPSTGVYQNPYHDEAKDEVIRNCEKVVTGLNTPQMPTHITLQNTDSVQQTNPVQSNYCSPLNRNHAVNYKFTTIKNKNEVLLIPSLISAIETNARINLTPIVIQDSDKKDASVQTMNSHCDQCQLNGTFRQENKSIQTIHRTFLKTVHSQVTEEDLASSKFVFTPNQSTNSSETEKPVSLTHMTPAQILVAELKAKTKIMQRSAVDSYRQSGGNLDESNRFVPQKENPSNNYQYRNIKPLVPSYHNKPPPKKSRPNQWVTSNKNNVG